MDMITRLTWLILMRGMSWIPLLLMGIHSMGLTMDLLIILARATTMPLIAMAIIAMALTLGPGILGIWVTPALL